MLTRPARLMHRMPMPRAPSRGPGKGGVYSFRWNAATGSPTGYRLYWGTSASTYTSGPHEDTGTALEELYTAVGLSANTTYFVVVRAFNGAGESANSNEIQVRNGVQIWP